MTEFCDAVDKKCNIVAEFLADIVQIVFRVLDNIVKQCADDAFVIHTEFKKNFRYGNRVHNIRLAGTPELVFMRIVCEEICFFDFCTVILGICLYLLEKLIKMVVIFFGCAVIH